jgi:glycosyltransferase involved in cell wall biosynthesis
MRLGIIGTRGYPYVYSGYETFVGELAPRLVERGHEVTVYCHRGLFVDRPRQYRGVDLVYVPSLERKVLSQFSHSGLATVHAVFSSADVLLYVNSANGPFGVVTKLFRKKTAINVDGLEWLRPKWKGLGARYFRAASFLATKLFDVVITDSTEMARIYRQEFHCSSATIAYGAVPGASVQPELTAQFGISPHEYYLVVGRLIPDNNVDLVVSAYERSGSNRKLVILGDVPYKDSFAESVRATRDPRILFPGYVRDPAVLKELYCNAFAYIHGHQFGGTNPSLLKALAYGCCVLALDTVFAREVLDQGKYGYFFDKDVSALAGAIDRIDHEPGLARVMSDRSRDRIVESYTWERITDQYEQLLSGLAMNPVDRKMFSRRTSLPSS